MLARRRGAVAARRICAEHFLHGAEAAWRPDVVVEHIFCTASRPQWRTDALVQSHICMAPRPRDDPTHSCRTTFTRRRGRVATRRMCGSLNLHGALAPWSSWLRNHGWNHAVCAKALGNSVRASKARAAEPRGTTGGATQFVRTLWAKRPFRLARPSFN